MGITENIVLSVIIETLKGVVYAIPKAIYNWKFRRFFGLYSTTADNIYAVVDPYTLPLPRIANRYIKHFLGRRPDQPLIGEDNVLGVNAIRVITYVTSLFSAYRKKNKPINVVIDEKIAGIWKGTFICFGSSDSNIKTYEIENLKEQTFYTFDFGPKDDNEESIPTIDIEQTHYTGTNKYRRFNISEKSFGVSRKRDHGVLLKMENPHCSGHYLFICAGHGEWGTSGTAYYLFNNWKKLYKEHKRKDFCKIIEVDFHSDESARPVHSVTK